ncbi:WYL domain-containing protein [Actinomycetaceae bacterium TAE3-ERU4]|nr:WYL domain-containing protein [Actinomycetaceae bacterium TAE3-ERU4]
MSASVVNSSERLLDLVLALANTKFGLTKQQLRKRIPGYDSYDSDASFDRIFSRDKERLEKAGLRILVSQDGINGQDFTYRLDSQASFNDEIQLRSSQAALVAKLADILHKKAGWDGLEPAVLALLGASEVDFSDSSNKFLDTVNFDSKGAQFVPILDMARNMGKEVEFSYSSGNGVRLRRVQVWNITAAFGAFYLVGLDTYCNEKRTYRLSRFLSVPQVCSDSSYCLTTQQRKARAFENDCFSPLIFCNELVALALNPYVLEDLGEPKPGFETLRSFGLDSLDLEAFLVPRYKKWRFLQLESAPLEFWETKLSVFLGEMFVLSPISLKESFQDSLTGLIEVLGENKNGR